MLRQLIRTLLGWLVIAAAVSALWRAAGSNPHTLARTLAETAGAAVSTVAHLLGELWQALFGGAR